MKTIHAFSLFTLLFLTSSANAGEWFAYISTVASVHKNTELVKPNNKPVVASTAPTTKKSTTPVFRRFRR